MKNHTLKKLVMLSVGLIFSIDSPAQNQPIWRTDLSSPEGPIARVDISFQMSSRSYMIIFEYKRKCEPLFSSLTSKTADKKLGRLIQRKPINTGIYFLAINGVRHTWYGGFTEYQNSVEIAIGLTQQAWNSLLSGPARMFFIEGDAGIYNVPVQGLVPAIKSASQMCLSKL